MRPGAFLLGWAAVLGGCSEPTPAPRGVGGGPPAPPGAAESIGSRAEKFCGSCHAAPRPDSLPRAAWSSDVGRGYRFYAESGRHDLDPPPINRLIAWYESGAPEAIPLPAPNTGVPSGPIRFRREVMLRASGRPPPGVSHLRLDVPPAADAVRLLVCDMMSGDVCRLTIRGRAVEPVVVGAVRNPAHVEPVDLDGDGIRDYLIADLGSALPEDHDRGQVVLARGTADADRYVLEPLLMGVGRVADARAADFDGDGDLDVVVAEFGLWTTGRLRYLEQTPSGGGPLKFRARVLDGRHGASHVPLGDLDGDGDMDFVALISQEFETVVAFLNSGGGGFEMKEVWSAGHPGYGSSGIRLADLDGDGDLDVVLTNGDSFDSRSQSPKALHSVQWLENEGRFPFRRRHLAYTPGVMASDVGDLDGDGDLDIAVVTMTGRTLDAPCNTVIWFEQTRPREFRRHDLDVSKDQHAAVLLADVDADGDLDIVVGEFEPSSIDRREWFSIWWNEGRSDSR